MRKSHMSNSERQARSKNHQEQQQLKKQLEKLSLKETNNKNSGRAETQKWRQFLRDCVKNTGNCSTTMEQALNDYHNNMSISERGYDVLTRHRSRSESQLCKHYQKSMTSSSNSVPDSTKSLNADLDEASQNTVHSERSSGLSKSFTDTAGREATANFRGAEVNFHRPVSTWVSSTLLLCSKQSLPFRTPMDPFSNTSQTCGSDRVGFWQLPCEIKSCRSTSCQSQNTDPRIVCMSSQQEDFRTGSNSQNKISAESESSVPSSINNFHMIKTQNAIYHCAKGRKVEEENARQIKTDKKQEDGRRREALLNKMTAHLGNPLTGKNKSAESCPKSLLTTITCNSHEGSNPEILGQNNTKGEVKYLNNNKQSKLRVISSYSLEPLHKKTTPNHKRELSVTRRHSLAGNSVKKQHEARIQFSGGLGVNSTTQLLLLHDTGDPNTITKMNGLGYRDVQNVLEISDFVKTPLQTSNISHMEGIDLANDPTIGDIQSKGEKALDTKIDLSQLEDRYQKTVPEKDSLDFYDSNNLILSKDPVLFEDKNNPDRITTRQPYGTANQLTGDRNKQSSIYGGKLEGSSCHSLGHSSNYYQPRKSNRDSVRSNTGQLSVNVGLQNANTTESATAPSLRCHKTKQDRNLLLTSACNRQTLNAFLPENVTEKHTISTASHKLGPSSVHLSTSSSTVINSQADDFDYIGSCLIDRPRKKKIDRTEIDRPVKVSHMLNIRCAETSPSSLNPHRESFDACQFRDEFDNIPASIGDDFDNVKQNTLGRSPDVKQDKISSKPVSYHHQPSQSDRKDSVISFSREPSSSNINQSIESVTLVCDHTHSKELLNRLSDNKLAKQPSTMLSYSKYTKEPSTMFSYSKDTKQPSTMLSYSKDTKEPSTMFSYSKDTKQPSTMLSYSKDTKEPSTMLSYGKDAKEPSIMLSNKKQLADGLAEKRLSRKSLQKSSKIEHFRELATVAIRKSAENVFNAKNKISVKILSHLKDSKNSSNLLSDINQTIAANSLSNINQNRESAKNLKWPNSAVYQNMNNEESRLQPNTEDVLFSHGENNECTNEINHAKNNYVDNNNFLSYESVPMSQTVSYSSNTTGSSKESLPLYHSRNAKLFEHSVSVSSGRDVKLTPVKTSSYSASQEVAPPDPSLLSHVKHVTTENCPNLRTIQRAGRKTQQHHKHVHECWLTVGSRVIACSQLQKPTMPADVMVSKKSRQRVITQMAEDNHKRQINKQKMLADVALRMRVERFLRSF